MVLQRLRRLRRTWSNLLRLRRITAVLVHHGLVDVARRLQFHYYLKWTLWLLRPRGERPRREKVPLGPAIRGALEELGPTFQKLGQILSTRADLLPAEVIRELTLLQDRVPPFPFQEVRRLLQEEGLAEAADRLLAEIEEKPLAAATMAQVHGARTREGRSVVLKVQRPGIGKTLLADVDLLADLAAFAERDPEVRQRWRPRELVAEFEDTVRRELDFTLEARVMDRFAGNFGRDRTVKVPSVVWELTSHRVLTMERVEGIKVSEREELLEAGLSPHVLARRGARAVLRQILQHGLFHGDPHPGNVMALPGNVVCFLDFGIIGRVDRDLREQLVDMLVGIIQQDAGKIVETAVAAGWVEEETDLRRLRSDVADFLDRYHGLPLSRIRIAEVFDHFFHGLTRHRVRFPSDLVLLAKALATMEAVARRLDPDFDAVSAARPHVERVLRRRLSPRQIGSFVAGAVKDSLLLARRLPSDVARIIDLVRRNRLEIGFRHEHLEGLATEIDRSSNRLAFGVIIAALIVGSAILIQANVGPFVYDLPVLGLAGFVIAGIMGFSLAVAIWRSGKL